VFIITTIVATAIQQLSQLSEANGAFNFFVILRSFCSNAMRQWFIVQFVLACASVKSRFYALNEHVKNITSERNKKSVGLKSLSIRKVARVFHSLADLVDIINETFTFHFIWILLIILVS
jgi:7tm Chemosensory receptor